MQNVYAEQRAPSTGVFFALLGATCFGTTGTIQALAPEASQPLIIGTMRLIVGGAAMVLWVLLRNGFSRNAPWPKVELLIATVGIVSFQTFFFQSLVRTGVAVGTTIAIGVSPILGGIIEYLTQGNPPKRTWYAATFWAVAGLAILSFGCGESKVDGVGILMALVAGTGYAFYAAKSQILLRDHSPSEMVATVFSLGGVLMCPLLFIYDVQWMASPKGVTSVILIGLVGTALACNFFAIGLATLPLSTGLTLGLAEPMVAALFGILLLSEPCSVQTVTGILSIFIGMFVMARNP